MMKSTTLTDAIAQRKARTAARQHCDRLGVLCGRLYHVENPRERAEILDDQADVLADVVSLYSEAYPDGPLWAALAAMPGLCRLVAATERALADSAWTPVEEVTPRNDLWFAGAFVQVIDARGTEDGYEVDVRFADGDVETVGYPRGAIVRTGGWLWSDPYREVRRLAAKYGVPDTELKAWEQLATARDREERSERLSALAHKVAGRVGDQAAEHVHDIAASERQVACASHGHPHPAAWLAWPGSRVLVVGAFVVGAGCVLISALPVWAALVPLLGVAAAGWGAVPVLSRVAARHPAFGGSVRAVGPGGEPMICPEAMSCTPLACVCGLCPVRFGRRSKRQRDSRNAKGREQ